MNEAFQATSVSDGDTYVVSVLFSPRGWQAHNREGKYVGEFEDDTKAVARLRMLAAVQST